MGVKMGVKMGVTGGDKPVGLTASYELSAK